MKMRFSSPLKSAIADQESWVFSLPIGVPVFTGESMRTFTEKQAGEYVRNTNEALEYFRASASGSAYSFPVKVNHKTSGTRFGDVREAKVGGIGSKRGVYLRVRWNPDTWAEIRASRYQHVSVGVDPSFTLQNGKKLGPLIVELSLTEEPRITSIGTIQDTIGLRLSRARFAQGEGQMEEVLSALEALIAATSSNSDMLAQVLALLTPVAEAVDAGAAPEEFDASTTEDDKKKEDEKVALSRLATAVTNLAAQQATTQSAVERFSRMNLGERGRQGFSAPAGKPTREQRKAQLQAAGLSKEMVARTLLEEF